MEKRINLYVSRKNVLTWIAAVLIVASAAMRIVLACMDIVGGNVWTEVVLPVAATLLFVWILLVWGKVMFYKTALGVWFMGLYYALRPGLIFAIGSFTYWLLCVAILFFCIAYTAITAGRIRQVWLLMPLFLAPLGACVYFAMYPGTLANAQLYLLPELLLFVGACIMTLAIRPYPMGEYHPTWGDRIDGRKIRTLAPMAQITAYFQVERNTCSNLFEDAIEVTQDRKSTRLNSSHKRLSRMPSSA